MWQYKLLPHQQGYVLSPWCCPIGLWCELQHVSPWRTQKWRLNAPSYFSQPQDPSIRNPISIHVHSHRLQVVWHSTATHVGLLCREGCVCQDIRSCLWVHPSDVWRVISLMCFLRSGVAEVLHLGTDQRTPRCLSFSIPLMIGWRQQFRRGDQSLWLLCVNHPLKHPNKCRKVNNSSSHVKCCIPRFLTIRHIDTENYEGLEPVLYSEGTWSNHRTCEECFQAAGQISEIRAHRDSLHIRHHVPPNSELKTMATPSAHVQPIVSAVHRTCPRNARHVTSYHRRS
jgi:hypothetical protein